MIGQLSNHVWQSTLFAIAAALLTLAFRKNRAAVRYGLWFTASLKFVIPFSLLMSLGGYIGWAPVAKRVAAPAISFTMVQLTRPFPNALPSLVAATGPKVDLVSLAILRAWVCGFLAIVVMRFRGWRRIRSAVRSSTPIEIRAAVEVRSSPGFLEPGVVGVFHPILLLPESIPQRLSAPQFEAVLGHELCHIQRRDNLTSAIHMIVEAVFWFHPMVWWIGARLVEERERACDEAVLGLGSEPHDYAEGILNVCKSYLESPLSCVSGVTGSNLKKRIQAILAGDAPDRVTLRKKFALAAAGMATLAFPVVVGIISAAHIQAQFEMGVAAPKFELVSIKSCEAYRTNTVYSAANPTGVSNTLRSECTTVQHLIQQAYGLFANGHMNPLSSVTIAGGPAWTRSDLYEIDAKTEEPKSMATMNGPVLQAILEDRFKLRVHRESREVPVYDLTVAKGGPKVQPFQGNCIPWDYDHPNPGPEQCATSGLTSTGVDMSGATIADLCVFFAVTTDRHVIDRTGLAGRFYFHLEFPAEDLGFFRQAHGMPALSDPAAPAADPSLVSAIKTAVEKLGLNLEPSGGPGEFVVIDSVTEPRP